MTKISPVDGYLVNPERVGRVVSPAYDAMTPAQRHLYATAHPHNYLNVMRSREEFPEAQCPSMEELLESNRARLQQMIADDDFIRLRKPGYFIYRLAVDGHTQTGLVAEIPVAEYLQGQVKRHEHTQAVKEDDLTIYQRVVRASSSPVCLTYHARADVETLLAELTARNPTLDFVSDDGAHQSVWLVEDAEDFTRLERTFEKVSVSYLTDGHHRAASAVRFMNLEREDNPHHSGEEPYNKLLVSFFPSNELRILEYNRFVQGMNGKSVAVLLAEIEQSFKVECLTIGRACDARPRKRGEFAMYLAGHWYRLIIKTELIPRDLVAALDVSILQDRLLHPVLGISEPRTDARMGYMSGALSLEVLGQQCAAQEQIGFAVFPTDIEDLMAVADAGRVMPPKSTWFDPKLRWGIFLLLR